MESMITNNYLLVLNMSSDDVIGRPTAPAQNAPDFDFLWKEYEQQLQQQREYEAMVCVFT